MFGERHTSFARRAFDRATARDRQIAAEAPEGS